MSNTISLSREILDHPIVGMKHPERMAAWIWLLCQARWKAKQIEVKGQIVALKRGQLCHSLRFMAESCNMTKSSFDRFLTRLKTGTGDGPMIETATGTGQLLITICNYDKYQLSPSPAGTAAGTTTGTASGTGAGQERDNIEEGIRRKNNVEALPGLDPPRGKPKGKLRFDDDLEIPEEVNSAYLDHRRKKRSPPTEHAMELLSIELRKIRDQHRVRPVDVVNHAILSGWTGIKASWDFSSLQGGAASHQSRRQSREEASADAFLRNVQQRHGLPQ